MSYSPSAPVTDLVSLDNNARARGRAPLRIPALSGNGERNGELVVEVAGRGPPVVLIHGWAVDRRMWSHQLAAFRRVFTTITYDRRGAGETSAPCDYALELQDLDTILDEIGVPKAGLLGMSQGGRVALQYAMTRPHRVTGLVLQGVPLDDPPARTTGDSSLLPLDRFAELVRRGNKESLIRELEQHPLMSTGPRRTLVQDEIIAMLKDYRGEDLTASPAEHLPLHAADLREVRAPTLVITGSRELLWFRRVADRMARNIYGARRRVIRGGGHFVNMTHAGDYNRCVVEFFINTTRVWSERALGSI
jgi:pimeloyl-ACP methyl ester carboxylesterase